MEEFLKDKSKLSLIIKHSRKQEQNKEAKLQRGSKYMGVSLNSHGNWQINFKYDKQIVYLGSTNDLYRAITVYDMVQIQLKGLQARTNFDYNKSQVIGILWQPNLMALCK